MANCACTVAITLEAWVSWTTRDRGAKRELKLCCMISYSDWGLGSGQSGKHGALKQVFLMFNFNLFSVLDNCVLQRALLA